MVIALAPGGGVDTSGRILGQKFVEAWSQQIVAENRPGAGGTIAAEVVARAAPDEFTAYLKTETVKWGKLIREAGIRAN